MGVLLQQLMMMASASAAPPMPVAWDAARNGTGIVLSNSNIDAAPVATSTGTVLAGPALAKTAITGRYIEFKLLGAPGSGARAGIGIADQGSYNSYVGSSGRAFGWYNNGDCYSGGSRVAGAVAYAPGDLLMLFAKYDPATDRIRFWPGKNGTWIGDPALGTGYVFALDPLSVYTFSPACGYDAAPTTAKFRIINPADYLYKPAGALSWWD